MEMFRQSQVFHQRFRGKHSAVSVAAMTTIDEESGDLGE